jgi:hypothetical protein
MEAAKSEVFGTVAAFQKSMQKRWVLRKRGSNLSKHFKLWNENGMDRKTELTFGGQGGQRMARIPCVCNVCVRVGCCACACVPLQNRVWTYK